MHGVTVWFTGLPASGKSTVARHLSNLLNHRGVRNELLDGDHVRRNLSRGLGFSKSDRDDNVARIGLVCHLLTRNGVVAIAACVSPYAEARDTVRQQIGDFLEVYVSTPPEACERRDSRGRYAAARRGELPNFTGVDDPYEAPKAADVRVDCSQESPELCAARVLQVLEDRGFLPTTEAGIRAQGDQPLEETLKRLGYQ